MSKMSMLRPAALALAVACALGTAAPAHADDAKQAALEARVDQLEKQVQALLAELKAQKAAAPAATAAAPAPAGKAPIQTTTITPGSPAGTTFTFGGCVERYSASFSRAAPSRAGPSLGSRFSMAD